MEAVEQEGKLKSASDIFFFSATDLGVSEEKLSSIYMFFSSLNIKIAPAQNTDFMGAYPKNQHHRSRSLRHRSVEILNHI